MREYRLTMWRSRLALAGVPSPAPMRSRAAARARRSCVG